MDMDTTVRGIQMEEDDIVRIVKEILMVDVNDGIVFEYESIEPIREEDAYNNFRVHLRAKYGKIDTPMKITERNTKACSGCRDRMSRWIKSDIFI